MEATDGDEAARHDLIRRAGAVSTAVNELAFDHLSGRPTDGFSLLGEGAQAIDHGLTRLEPVARRSVWSMYPTTRFHPLDPMHDLNQHSQDRGVDLRTVVSEHCLTVNPLISSTHPDLRVGQVATTFILIDEALAVVFGPPTRRGEPTAWTCAGTGLFDAVKDLWHDVWDTSRPAVDPGQPPPFTARQVAVASRMVTGVKDAVIARELGVSVRTVVAEVALVIAKLGANGRVDAVLRMGTGSPDQVMGRQLG